MPFSCWHRCTTDNLFAGICGSSFQWKRGRRIPVVIHVKRAGYLPPGGGSFVMKWVAAFAWNTQCSHKSNRWIPHIGRYLDFNTSLWLNAPLPVTLSWSIKRKELDMSILWAICGEKQSPSIKRVPMDQKTQEAVNHAFLSQEVSFREGIERQFDENWMSDEDEIATTPIPGKVTVFSPHISPR